MKKKKKKKTMMGKRGKKEVVEGATQKEELLGAPGGEWRQPLPCSSGPKRALI